MTRYFSLLLLLPACEPWFNTTPPDQISIDPSFTNLQKETIHDVLDNYCMAVNWCPEEVGWLEPIERGRFIVDTYDFSRFGYDRLVAALNTWEYIYYDPNHWAFNDDRAFWLITAHEIGHWGTGIGHLAEHSIMEAPMKNMDTRPLELDCVTVETWKSIHE